MPTGFAAARAFCFCAVGFTPTGLAPAAGRAPAEVIRRKFASDAFMRCVFTVGAARRVFCGAYPALVDAAAYRAFAVFIELAVEYPALADVYPALAVEYAARCVFAPFAV